MGVITSARVAERLIRLVRARLGRLAQSASRLWLHDQSLDSVYWS